MDKKYVIEINGDRALVCDTLEQALEAAADRDRHAPGSDIVIADVRLDDLTLDANGDGFDADDDDLPACGVDWTSYTACGYDVYLDYGRLCKPLDRGSVTWYGLDKLGSFLVLNLRRPMFDLDAVLDEIERQINEQGLMAPDEIVSGSYELGSAYSASRRPELISFDVEAISNGDEITGMDVRF